MKKIAWVVIVLLGGVYFVNTYIQNEAKRKAERAEEQKIEQALKSSIKEMVLRTNATKGWGSRLSKGETYRFAPILTIELEKLWISEKPILFIGTINDISTYDKTKYTILFERNLFTYLKNMFSTKLQLSLIASKKKIDDFLKNNPKLFEGVGFNHGVAIIAKVESIKTNKVAKEEGSPEIIKIGQGELIDILFIGDVRL